MSKTFPIATIILLAFSAAADAAIYDYQVSEFLPGTPSSDGVWYANTADGGTASVVSLLGAGGNLENNQPLPIGAAKLTTTYNSNASRADALITGEFGDASDFLRSANLSYSYYKEQVASAPGDNPGSNQFAAPALRLLIDGTGGQFGGSNPTRDWGYLVYEPYWNQGTGYPVEGAWDAEVIDPNIGFWWWTGGFNVANGAGGPPLDTLSGWLTALGADSDFANAIIAGIGVGVGSFNAGQIGYFDAVSYTFNGDTTTWNFEPQAVVPEPMAIAVWSVLGLCGSAFAWRAKRRQLAA